MMFLQANIKILDTIQTQYQPTGKKTNRVGMERGLACMEIAIYDYLVLSIIG
jgi:hypothetical protein